MYIPNDLIIFLCLLAVLVNFILECRRKARFKRCMARWDAELARMEEDNKAHK